MTQAPDGLPNGVFWCLSLGMSETTQDIIIPAWVEGDLRPVEKLRVHREGFRHMAVSVFVISDRGLLLQRRALTKYHTPGLWANTCCTHPYWGEAPAACATRRLREELGIGGLDLRHRGQVEYRADVGGGLIEHEVVEVFAAVVPADVAVVPNPTEVMDTTWLPLDELRDDIASSPARYTPWLRIYMAKHEALIFGS